MDGTKAIPLRQFIEENGLDSLRGKPIHMGEKVVYIHDRCLESDISLYADEPHEAKRINRFYGGESPDAEMAGWIYTSQATISQ